MEISKKVFSETVEVLNHSEKDIIEKIPEKFMKFLNENKDKEYIPNIDFTNEHWEDTIDEDTKAILAIIYRDYIVSEEERLALIKEENEEKIRVEQELREKYNPDNLFKKKHNTEENKNIETTQLVKTEETSWLRRLLKKIASIFKINR